MKIEKLYSLYVIRLISGKRILEYREQNYEFFTEYSFDGKVVCERKEISTDRYWKALKKYHNLNVELCDKNIDCIAPTIHLEEKEI